MDPHLLHLWKAKTGLERMWQLQRWNTTLRRRLTQLNKEIETHVATLSRQNWESLCNRLEHNMSLPQTWNLFRRLIHSTQCKTHQTQIMTKLIHASEASPQELLQTLRNHPIPLVSNIRILGLVLHSHGARCDTTQALRTQTQQATRLIRRVAHLHAGLRERNTCRLTQAYITSRTAYAFPYLPLKQKERDHIHALLRSCTKVALCLSPSTSTARLLNLGAHNRLEELEQATLRAQLTRLSGTATGRTLLCQLGIGPIIHSTEAAPLSPDLYYHLVIPPILKNMHPEHDGKRRADRTKALYKQYGGSSEVAYVDVATYSSGSCMEAAIALALISSSSAKILFRLKIRPIKISAKACYPVPRPGFYASGTPRFLGNEEVHSLARGLAFRAGVGPPPPALGILTHYRDTRRLYAPPALSLILTQASHWRRLQTRSAPYPILLHARYPDQLLSSCKLCGKPGDFLHVFLTCPTFPHPPSQTTAESHWETFLAS
ncbi:hypothetical protein HPB49_013329 [Dermacentor silvarum]|uniref:Uncharacterized protein n=1 Tax=Dermacentor silvarum TaxID=543639 RepID=A0ACB8CXI6_DERSI|nr:hypothetical protein HPB49_013329 [Dermacentor silvarum]